MIQCVQFHIGNFLNHHQKQLLVQKKLNNVSCIIINCIKIIFDDHNFLTSFAFS